MSEGSIIPNDSTIVLNRGVGGDTTDASAVTDQAVVDAETGELTPIKRERIVIGGDAARDQVLNLEPQNTVFKLPATDSSVLDVLQDILKEQKRQTAALRLLLSTVGVTSNKALLDEWEG